MTHHSNIDMEMAESILMDAGAEETDNAHCSFCRNSLVAAVGPLCHTCQLALLGEHDFSGAFGLCIYCGRTQGGRPTCRSRRLHRVREVLEPDYETPHPGVIA